MNFLALLFIFVQVVASSSEATTCPFSRYLAQEGSAPTRFSSRIEQAQFRDLLDVAFAIDSTNIFHQYLKGKLQPEMFLDCTTQSPALKILIERKFPIYFLIAAAKQTSESSVFEISKFGRSAAQYILSENLAPLQVDLLPPRTQIERNAGFDRVTGRLFFRIFEIAPEDWDLRFFHEFSHALDPLLIQGVRDYNDKQLVDPAIAIIRSHPSHLNVDQIDTLIRYLRAGSNRGMFAEYRAWVVSSWMYFKNTHSYPASLQNILGDTVPGDIYSLKKAWWQHIKSHFTLPKEGIFLHPLMIQAHQIMIDRVDPLTEDFGSLEQFLK